MKGRPPKRTMTAEQERAASAFVEAAEAPDSGSGRAERGEASGGGGRAPVVRRRVVAERPWEDERVRDDVVKGYALRLPEPLYLKLKWVAAERGQSMNELCRDAVEEVVEAHLRAHGEVRAHE